MPPFAAEQASTAAPLAFKVNSKNVQYTDSHIIADFAYENATVTKGVDGSYSVNPTSVKYTFKTETKVPRVGYVLVGCYVIVQLTLMATCRVRHAKRKRGTPFSFLAQTMIWICKPCRYLSGMLRNANLTLSVFNGE